MVSSRGLLVLAGLVLASGGAQAQTATVTELAWGNALSTVSQRHLVRVAPAGGRPTWLMAAQRGPYELPDPEGLHFYRSDDEGASWWYYQPIFEDGVEGRELHLTSDLAVIGADVALVYSYDTTSDGFPAGPEDAGRRVVFQRWRFDGADDWLPGPRITVASPGAGHAFHRAVMAVDSHGRIWIHAWERGPCSSSDGPERPDTLRAWVSSDGGQSFQAQPDLYQQPLLGGGGLVHLGDRLLAIWGDYSWDNPALYMIRDDDAPLAAWQGPFVAFPDGDSIYHGSALSAVADGAGGMHLVYKDRYEQLYYRHFDGNAFGPRTFVDGSGDSDWALQPAVTRHGDELYVCTNHLTDSGDNEIRSYRLSDGFQSWVTLDDRSDIKVYPSAAAELPGDAPTVPCAYGLSEWASELRVALRPVEGSLPPPPPPPPPPQQQPSPPPPPPPPETSPGNGEGTLGGLTDPFTGPGLDAGRWLVELDTAESSAGALGGVLRMGPGRGGSQEGGVHVVSRDTYALTGSSIHLRVQALVGPAEEVSTRLRLSPPDSEAHVGFWYELGRLYVSFGGGDGDEFPVDLAYDPEEHAFWRLREQGGTVSWETSPDGVTWTVQHTMPSAALGFDLGAVQVWFQVKAWGAPLEEAGETQLTDLNR